CHNITLALKWAHKDYKLIHDLIEKYHSLVTIVRDSKYNKVKFLNSALHTFPRIRFIYVKDMIESILDNYYCLLYGKDSKENKLTNETLSENEKENLSKLPNTKSYQKDILFLLGYTRPMF